MNFYTSFFLKKNLFFKLLLFIFEVLNKKEKVMKKLKIQSGIVSEVRVATLLRSDNEYLQYPCKVVIHVTERDIYGNIMSCVANIGEGAFVRIRRAEFLEMTLPLEISYSQLSPSLIKELLNIY